jgi:hypothetical protein
MQVRKLQNVEHMQKTFMKESFFGRKIAWVHGHASDESLSRRPNASLQAAERLGLNNYLTGKTRTKHDAPNSVKRYQSNQLSSIQTRFQLTCRINVTACNFDFHILAQLTSSERCSTKRLHEAISTFVVYERTQV